VNEDSETNTYLDRKIEEMEGETRLESLVESMIGLVVECLKKRKVKRKCYRPRLCYVCRRQGHLARSYPDQAKYERQEQFMDVRFMKIIDPNVGDNENPNQIGKGRRINEIFKGKETPIKNEALSVRSDEETNASSEPKTAGIVAKEAEHKASIRYQKPAEMDSANKTSGSCHCKGIENKTTKMKSGVIPVKSIGKRDESNESKGNEVDFKKNEHKTFIIIKNTTTWVILMESVVKWKNIRHSVIIKHLLKVI